MLDPIISIEMAYRLTFGLAGVGLWSRNLKRLVLALSDVDIVQHKLGVWGGGDVKFQLWTGYPLCVCCHLLNTPRYR